MASVYDKYGVPNDQGLMESQIQPKLQYRFKVEFVNFGNITNTFALTKNITKAAIPKFNYEPQEIDSYVSKYYILGKPSIDTVTVSVRNDVNNIVGSIIQAQKDRQFNNYYQSTAPNVGDIKFEMKIMWLNGSNSNAPWPNGNGAGVQIIEGWHLTGCMLSDVEWGDMDYKSSEPNEISLTIRPDNAFHIIDPSKMGSVQDINFTNSAGANGYNFQGAVTGNNSAT